MAKKITDFRGEYLFLSNFYPFEMVYDGEHYSTVEHAFQAAKCVNTTDKEKIISARTPAVAKKLGRRVQLRSDIDWDQHRDSIMENILNVKFNDEKLRDLLNKTKGYELVEGNNWHDQYWGSCICSRHNNTPGKNILGNLLMKIRDTQ